MIWADFALSVTVKQITILIIFRYMNMLNKNLWSKLTWLIWAHEMIKKIIIAWNKSYFSQTTNHLYILNYAKHILDMYLYTLRLFVKPLVKQAARAINLHALSTTTAWYCIVFMLRYGTYKWYRTITPVAIASTIDPKLLRPGAATIVINGRQ